MPFRDFFTILGLLAVTALMAVVAVERSSGSDPVTNAPNSASTSKSVTKSTTVTQFELTLNSGTFTANGKTFKTNTGTIKVQETRGKSNSPFIALPVVRIRTTAQTPKPPVALLGDGPGLSNLWAASVPTWLLAERDVFMIGYRGVDGSVSLAMPAFKQALSDAGVDDHSTALSQAALRDLKRLQAGGVDLDRYSLADVVEDVDKVFAALDIEKVSLYSVGFGTQVAYRYAQAHPSRVEAIVMIDPKGFQKPSDPTYLDEALAHAESWQVLNWGDVWLKAYAQSPQKVIEAWPQLAGFFEDLNLHALPKPTVPTRTLVVYGNQNPHLQDLDPLIRQLPQAQTLVIEPTGYVIDLSGQPERGLQRLVNAFLNQGALEGTHDE